MGVFSVLVNIFVDFTTLAGGAWSPFSDAGSQPQVVFAPGDQARISEPHAGFVDDPVTFAPEGSYTGITCQYNLSRALWEPCNDAQDRSCWLRRTNGERTYTVSTDYEDPDEVPEGIDRHVWLEVGKTTLTDVDGVPKEAMTFNGTYPGPTIEACWGDNIMVHVTNKLPDMGTTVHWHGVRQFLTNEMDGVPATQCPIARNDSYTYAFRALQHGHSWYHSHYSLQYPDGLAAPLVVFGPASAAYDAEVPPLLVSDWVHESASEAFQAEKTTIAAADGIVLNGKGHAPSVPFTPATTVDYNVTTFQQGKRHLMRLINGAAGTSFVFSIDGHNLTIVATDFVAVEPFTVTSLVIGIGQRYTIIVQGLDNQSVPAGTAASSSNAGNWWIRTHPADGCNRFTTTPPSFDSASSPSEPFDVRTGIIHYSGGGDRVPSNAPREPCSKACIDVAMRDLVPVVPWFVDQAALNDVAASTFFPAHQTANDSTLGQAGNYTHWMLRLDPGEEAALGRDFHAPFWLNFSNPLLLNLTDGPADPHYSVVNYTFPDPQGFIFMVIDGSQLFSGGTPNSTAVLSVAHPMHWHGSDVVVLGQSTGAFDPVRSPATWRYDNPPRRDVVLVPAGGYVAVAFKPDNPGVWLVHCHIAWHASAGLALQMIVQQDQIDPMLAGARRQALDDGCAAWNSDFATGQIFPQDDSGI